MAKRKRALTEKQKKDIIKWLDDAVEVHNSIKALSKRSDALHLVFCEGNVDHIQLSSDLDGVNGFERVCESLGLGKDDIKETVLSSIGYLEQSFKYKGYHIIHLIKLEEENSNEQTNIVE